MTEFDLEDLKKLLTPRNYLEEFIDHIRTHYKLDECYTFRFDTMIEKWFQYDDGYYKQVPIQQIYSVYWNIPFTTKTSNTKLSHCIKWLEAETQFDGKWMDHDPNYDNCLNGIVNITTHKLLSHTPRMMFKHQVPRNFDSLEGQLIPKQFATALECIPNEQQREYFLKFFLNTIHKRFEDEVFLMLYGVKGAGKSTLIQIFSCMFGPAMTSHTSLNKLGGTFGKSAMYDKRVNCEPDLPIVPLYPNAISEIKKITGEDGELEVSLKFRTPFNYPVSCFNIFGINQLMGFTDDAEKEIDSIMRRVVLVNCPNMMLKDAEFKKLMRSPKFLDKLYSWAMWAPCYPIYEPEEEEEWIRHNKELWLLNSNPILKILQEEFEFCPTDYDETEEGVRIYQEKQKVKCTEVREVVADRLEEEGYLVPTQIRKAITEALKTMKIYRGDTTGTKASYENIVRRAEP